MIKKVAILGAGAFGTALSLIAHRAGHAVTLITKTKEHAEILNTTRLNQEFLKNITIPPSITITSETLCINQHDVLIIATPAQTLFDIAKSLSSFLNPSIPIILSSKGIVDADPLPFFPYQIVKNLLSNPLALLSGPNFAIELAQGMPSAADLAVENFETQENLAKIFVQQNFRIYLTEDFVGVQLAGVVKNVLAIACGMSMGYGYGANTTAALMTRGLAEMTRLGRKLGAKLETFLGLSGVGDLTLTCSSSKSRNYSLGFQLGLGVPIDDLLSQGQPLSEGYHSAAPLLKLAEHHSVSMPLCASIYKVLHGSSIQEEIDELLNRPFRPYAE
jgi:glycerol-3-phosphate dehydrogenase (NAD(P)+)